MSLLTTEETRLKLEEKINKCSENILILSSFVTKPGLKWLEKIIPNNVNVKIAARWKLSDLVSKASSIEAYEFCKSKGWFFGVDHLMHSKVYCIDDGVLLGSANLTAKGLGLLSYKNRELSTYLEEPTKADFKKIKSEEEYITWLDDNLFKEILYEYEKNKNKQEIKVVKFSDELVKKLSPEIRYLWINDLKDETPEQIIQPFDENDESMFEELEKLKTDFKESKVYHWVKQILLENKEEKTRFGWVTQMLHDALIDEPPPHRKDVKIYVSILYDWIEFACSDEIEIKKWNHTKSLHLKN